MEAGVKRAQWRIVLLLTFLTSADDTHMPQHLGKVRANIRLSALPIYHAQIP